MKTLVIATAAMLLANAVNVSPALAQSSKTPHYAWQYHYVGHHPQYRSGWVLVR